VIAAHADDDGRGCEIRYGLDVEFVQDKKRQGVVEKTGREVEIGATGVRIEKTGVEIGPSVADPLDCLVEIAKVEADGMTVPGRPEVPELNEDPLRRSVAIRKGEGRSVSLGGDDKCSPALRLGGSRIPVRGVRGRQDQRGRRKGERQKPPGSCLCVPIRHRPRPPGRAV